MDEAITTQRGRYGRLGVTVPIRAKNEILEWARRCGVKKAEFLRWALMTGALQIVTSYGRPNAFERYAASLDEAEGGEQAGRPQA